MEVMLELTFYLPGQEGDREVEREAWARRKHGGKHRQPDLLVGPAGRPLSCFIKFLLLT